MNLAKKRDLLQKRRWRIRKKIIGTQDRPRLTVRFTNKNIHAQCINDDLSTTLVAISSNEKELKKIEARGISTNTNNKTDKISVFVFQNELVPNKYLHSRFAACS